MAKIVIIVGCHDFFDNAPTSIAELTRKNASTTRPMFPDSLTPPMKRKTQKLGSNDTACRFCDLLRSENTEAEVFDFARTTRSSTGVGSQDRRVSPLEKYEILGVQSQGQTWPSFCDLRYDLCIACAHGCLAHCNPDSPEVGRESYSFQLYSFESVSTSYRLSNRRQAKEKEVRNESRRDSRACQS